MGNSLWSAEAIVAVLMLSGTHLAFGQKQEETPPPPNKESAEWERTLKGLKQAKPIPDPSHLVTPKTVTPSGGVQGFEPKTGEVTAKPASTKSAGPPRGHKEGKEGAQPNNADGGKPNDGQSGGQSKATEKPSSRWKKQSSATYGERGFPPRVLPPQP
jgi:hypothetical protein